MDQRKGIILIGIKLLKDKNIGFIDIAEFLKDTLPNKYEVKKVGDKVIVRKQNSLIEVPSIVRVSPFFVLGCGLFMAEARKGAQESTSSFYGMDISPGETDFLHLFMDWTKETFGINKFSAEIGYDQKIENNLQRHGISINDIKERFFEEFPLIKENSLNLYKRKEHKGGLTFTICYREPGKTRLLLDISTMLSARIFEFVNGMIQKPSWLSVSEDCLSRPIAIIDMKKWITDFRYGKEPGLHEKIIYWIKEMTWYKKKTKKYIILDEEGTHLVIKKERGKNHSFVFKKIPIMLNTLTQAALYVGEGMTNNLGMTNKDPRIIINFLNYINSISPRPKTMWGVEIRVWWFFDCLSDQIRDRVLELLKSVNERHERTEMVNVILFHLKRDFYRKINISERKRKKRILNLNKITLYKTQAILLNELIENYKGEWCDISRFNRIESEVLDRIKRNLDFSEGGVVRPWIRLSLSLEEVLSKYQKMVPFVVPVGLNTDFQEGIERKEYIGIRVKADSTLNELLGKCQTGPNISNKSLSYALVTDFDNFIAKYASEIKMI